MLNFILFFVLIPLRIVLLPFEIVLKVLALSSSTK